MSSVAVTARSNRSQSDKDPAGGMDRTTDPHAMVRLDIAFHDAGFAATGHQRLAAAWETIRCQVHLFLLTRIGLSTEGYLGCIPQEHQALAAALRARDTQTALPRVVCQLVQAVARPGHAN